MVHLFATCVIVIFPLRFHYHHRKGLAHRCGILNAYQFGGDGQGELAGCV